jgi:translation initiation factor IF-3
LDGQQVGVLSLHEAIRMAQSNGVDLVEIAPTATPPVCRIVDYGKFRYEQAKKDKDAKKHHHANKVKEVQLSAAIDPHDFGVKLKHAIDFLCEEMKVKVSLRFRGREMAHQELGFGVVQKFISEVAPFAHPDAPPRLIGRGLTVMLSPLPRNKRAKNPNQTPGEPGSESAPDADDHEGEPNVAPMPTPGPAHAAASQAGTADGAGAGARPQKPVAFGQNPFANLDLKLGNVSG